MPLDQKREYVFPACAPIPIPNTSSPHCVEDNNRTHGPAARDVGDESTVAGRPRSLSPRQGRRRCGVAARRVVRGSRRARGRGGAWEETARVRGHAGRPRRVIASADDATARGRPRETSLRTRPRGGRWIPAQRLPSLWGAWRGRDCVVRGSRRAPGRGGAGGGRRRGSAATRDGRGGSSPPRTTQRRGGCRGRRRCGRGRGEGWGRWRGHAAADAAADEAARRPGISPRARPRGGVGGDGEGPRPRGTAAEGCRLRGRRDGAGAAEVDVPADKAAGRDGGGGGVTPPRTRPRTGGGGRRPARRDGAACARASSPRRGRC